ncbi:MAG: hypothetical protein ACRELD_07530 [Longimicrobiales bacterium]
MSGRKIFLLALSSACLGCYRYVPVEPGQLTPGAEVRAHLTEPGAEEMRSVLGSTMDMVDGFLIERGPDELTLDVAAEVRVPGYPATRLNQLVELRSDHIQTLELREIDHLRTTMLAAGIAAGAVAAVLSTRAIFGGEDETLPPDDPPPAAVWPIGFRIQFP